LQSATAAIDAINDEGIGGIKTGLNTFFLIFAVRVSSFHFRPSLSDELFQTTSDGPD